MVDVFGFNLIHGNVYSKKDLHDYFNGQQQGGISTPSDYPIILLFDTDRGQEYGYNDIWTEEGIFLWVGEGTRGDQKFTRGNKALLNHLEAEEEVFLFKHRESNLYEYVDQMLCIGFKWKKGFDVTGNIRDIIEFQLVRVNSLDEFADTTEIKEDTSIDELRTNILTATQEPPTAKERLQKVWQRSSMLKLYALKRAHGVCEGCNNKAPFKTRSGQDYLEVHHINKISDGGPEKPQLVAALCPNCHRKAHYSNESRQFNDFLLESIAKKERRFN